MRHPARLNSPKVRLNHVHFGNCGTFYSIPPSRSDERYVGDSSSSTEGCGLESAIHEGPTTY